MATKICTKCGIEKELSEFYKDSRTKLGYRSHCKNCILKISKKHYQNNREYVLERSREWRQDNPEKCRNIHRKWRTKNVEHVVEQGKKYYQDNKNYIDERHNNWRKNNPERIEIICKRHNDKRKRDLGYNPLNEKFEGSVGHHINKNDVIYIPEHIHKSIPHRQDDSASMEEINILAMEYV